LGRSRKSWEGPGIRKDREGPGRSRKDWEGDQEGLGRTRKDWEGVGRTGKEWEATLDFHLPNCPIARNRTDARQNRMTQAKRRTLTCKVTPPFSSEVKRHLSVPSQVKCHLLFTEWLTLSS